MKLSVLLSIAAIYMALVGLGLIFAPQAFGVGAELEDPQRRAVLGAGRSDPRQHSAG